MQTAAFNPDKHYAKDWLNSGRVMMFLGLLTFLPHLTYLPFSVSYYSLFVWGLFFLAIHFHSPKITHVLKIILTAVGLGIIAVSFSSITIGEMGNALLVLLIAIKPVESLSNKSKRTFVLICYFSVIVFFFREQPNVWLWYYLLCVALLTAFLQRVEFPDIKFSKALKEAVLLLLQAAPLVVILFFLFPRLSEPLMQWNPYEQGSESGIADQIELGDIGDLSLSDEVAFKVRFDGSVPDQSELYWRGPVFDFTDGRVWDSDFFTRQEIRPETRVDLEGLNQKAQIIRYEITQEANYKNWLIALDMPITDTDRAVISEEYQLMTDSSNSSLIHYSVESVLNYKTPPDPEHVYAKALQIPQRARMARQTRALGKRFRASVEGQETADQKIIQKALLHYSENPFYYTLDAPRYQSNPIDEFMFGSQAGYCTHYASSMTMLLRSADIPARMVTGYRGGEWNEIGEYLVVKQKHAHAWVEAWVDEYGWVRIDPTSAIPNDRILENSLINLNAPIFSGNISRQLNNLSGFEQLTKQQAEGAPLSNTQNAQSTETDSFDISSLFSDLSNQAQSYVQYIKDLSRYYWESWVEGFDYQRQKSLFNLSGVGSLLLMFALILVLIASYFSYMVLLPKMLGSSQQHPVQKIYDQLRKKLGKYGIRLPNNASHNELLQCAIEQGILDKQSLKDTFSTYERLRYAKNESEVNSRELKAFRTQVKNLFNHSV